MAYQFDDSNPGRQQNYIFQLVKDRTLTNIYHSHDFYELIWFLKGNGTQRMNDAVYMNQANTVVMLRPGDRHCFIDQTADIEMISLSVKKEEFELFAGAYDPFLLKHINGSPSPIQFALHGVFLSDLFQKAAQEITDYDCKLLLSYFLNTYITCTGCLQCYSGLPPRLAPAIRNMQQADNLQRGIPAFVELSHYSQSHLSKLIKQYFNMSLKQYINELRLQAAYNDIILTNRPTEEIAEGLGFSSYSHFHKRFKERFSITPAALRKSNRSWTV